MDPAGAEEKREDFLLVITSSGFHNAEVLSLLLSHTTVNSVIGVVTVGMAEAEQRLRAFSEYKNEILKNDERKIIHIDEDNLSEVTLEALNAVIILGGNSRLLFDSIRNSDTANALIAKAKDDNSTVITVSAASMLFTGGNRHCRWIDPILDIDQGFLQDFDHTGFGFLPDLILPHIEKFYEMNENLDRELDRIESNENIKIRRMKRSEYIVV